MPVPILTIDAFTDVPFRGNPAAVCFLDAPREDAWMQSVAAEMNLAETAFLLPRGDDWSLRWFAPLAEVDLCGHATLASAHALWETGRLPATAAARFHTRSGLLTAERRGGRIELDFPAQPAEPAEAPPGLLDALGIAAPRFVGRNRFDYFVELDSETAVRDVRPDVRRLLSVPTRGCVVTARSNAPGVDFVSRFFAPSVGIDEDPVTGSAHCCLGPYWGAVLGKAQMTGYQASRRGGTVGVRLAGDRVRLLGSAVTTLRGELIDR